MVVAVLLQGISSCSFASSNSESEYPSLVNSLHQNSKYVVVSLTTLEHSLNSCSSYDFVHVRFLSFTISGACSNSCLMSPEDAIQPSHPPTSSSPAFNLLSIQGLSMNWLSCIRCGQSNVQELYTSYKHNALQKQSNLERYIGTLCGWPLFAQ